MSVVYNTGYNASKRYIQFLLMSTDVCIGNITMYVGWIQLYSAKGVVFGCVVRSSLIKLKKLLVKFVFNRLDLGKLRHVYLVDIMIYAIAVNIILRIRNKY